MRCKSPTMIFIIASRCPAHRLEIHSPLSSKSQKFRPGSYFFLYPVAALFTSGLHQKNETPYGVSFFYRSEILEERCFETSLVISNMFTVSLPSNTFFNFSSALILRLFAGS